MKEREPGTMDKLVGLSQTVDVVTIPTAWALGAAGIISPAIAVTAIGLSIASYFGGEVVKKKL